MSYWPTEAPSSSSPSDLLRVGWLAEVAPEVAELTLNPVIDGPSDATVTNVRARVAPLPVAPPSVRRL